MKHVIAFLSLLLLISCATTEPFTLEPYVTEGTELSVNRGRSLLASSDGDVTVAVAAMLPEDRESLTLAVSVTNDTEARYLLQDSQFEVFAGNRDTGIWMSLGVWDADRYYSYAVEEARQRENSANAIGAIAIISSAAPAPGPGPGRRPGYRPAGDPLLTGVVVSNEIREVERANNDYLSFLSANLLFDSHLEPGETYTGIIVEYPDWKEPDLKLVFTGKSGEELVFIYSRSDR